MLNIVLIGAGKLGSRHLQALSQVKIKDTNIHVVDINASALSVAKDRLKEMPKNTKILNINYLTKISDLNQDKIDLAIIATTSEHRLKALKELGSSREVRNLILEKFLFQDEASYKETNLYLKRYKIRTWVNCTRRQWRFYRNLKKELAGQKIIKIGVSGSKWSIATSAIHFIDLISFLIDSIDYEISHLNFGGAYVSAYSIITGPRDSKFIEFFGSMHGRFKDATYFDFTCVEDDIPLSIKIETEKDTFYIFEELNKLFIFQREDNTINVLERAIKIPYQSELTNIAAEKIIIENKCDLTEYDDSSRLHQILLKSYLSYIGDIKGREIKICPIT